MLRHVREEAMVPFLKFQQRSKKAIAVCLWGPPGCGKSSANTHIASLLQIDPDHLILINRDLWNESLACTYFRKEYKTLLSARESRTVFNSLGQKQYTTSEEELQFWRFLLESPLNMLRCRDGNTLPSKMYTIFKHYFLRYFRAVLSKEDWESFWRHEHDTEEGASETRSVCNIFYAIATWWMQTYNKSYIIEISGKSFSETLMRKQVGSENNLLYIPFIDDLPALQSRVAQRNQFGSPNVNEIVEFYQNSYGTSLLQALNSGIFSQIIIQGNNTHNYVMLSLERITPKGYILVKEAANNI